MKRFSQLDANSIVRVAVEQAGSGFSLGTLEMRRGSTVAELATRIRKVYQEKITQYGTEKQKQGRSVCMTFFVSIGVLVCSAI